MGLSGSIAFFAYLAVSVKSEAILNAPIPRTLAVMTAPMVLGILALMFFQAADTYFIGLLGKKELAAVSFTFPVTFTVTSLSLGLAIGASILLGQAIGKGDYHLAQHITTDSVFAGSVIIAAVGITGYFSITLLFKALGASDSTLPLIQQYMSIWFLGVPLLVLPIMTNALLRATGDTVWPSLLMMAAGLVNAGLDPLLIFGWGFVPAFGIQGAAYASLASWAAGLVGAFYMLKYREKLLLFRLSAWPLFKSHTIHWLQVSLPICAAHILTPVAAAILTRLVAPYGDAAVAALGSGARIESISLVVTFALTAVLSAFVAQNLGAGKVERSQSAVRSALIFSLCFQALVYLGIVIFVEPIARLFSNAPDVIEHTRWFLYIIPAGSIAYGLLAIISTAFNASKHSNVSLMITLIRVVAFFAPCALLGGYLGDFKGLLIGTVVGGWLGTGFAYYVYVTKFSPKDSAADNAATSH